MSKRIATIDIGSNTFLLLISESDGRRVVPLQTGYGVVRLGEGTDKTGRISEAAMERAMDCLQDFWQHIRAAGCEQVYACGTSALRDASNSGDFIERVCQRFGLEIQIIEGRQEAAYSFYGALSDAPETPGPVLVVDIGGGSTELSFGDQSGLKLYASLKVGTVRMTERYIRHDPVTEGEVLALREAVRHQLAGVEFLQQQPGTIIQVDGTGTILATMALKLEVYDDERIHHMRLQHSEIEKLTATLIAHTIADRSRLPGLPANRADVILAGALIIDEILKTAGRNAVMISTRGLRYGMALGVARGELQAGSC